MKQEQSCSKIIGKRVRFKLTNDPYSDLKFNDLGTVVGVTDFLDHVGSRTKLWIRWDSSGNYTLVHGFESLDVFADVGI